MIRVECAHSTHTAATGKAKLSKGVCTDFSTEPSWRAHEQFFNEHEVEECHISNVVQLGKTGLSDYLTSQKNLHCGLRGNIPLMEKSISLPDSLIAE